jgi:anti-sigma regulatory factor (Ser/Thr protein kinase)
MSPTGVNRLVKPVCNPNRRECQGERLTESNDASGSMASTPAESDLLVTLQLNSNPEALCLVRAAVGRATELLHFQDRECRAIVRSVDEALANVIRHAYQGKNGLPIEVTCRKWQGNDNGSPTAGLEIVLLDSGIALDPASLQGRELDDIRPGGLGLHFIKQSMDQVEFSRNHGKNQLRMIKYLVPATAQAKPEGE